MNGKFEIYFLDEAIDFMNSLDVKTRRKVYFNIRKSQMVNDPILFKKLTDYIWEFRTLFEKKNYRLFAFWDKTDNKETLVLATHGVVKKTQKTPKKEIKKAEEIRRIYFKQKTERNEKR
jgi:phage-related protein